MAETKIKAGQFSGIVGHGTDGYFLMTNGDGTMAWAEGGATGPSVTSVSYPGDDTAADPAGGQTVVLTGTNFGSSMTVSIGGTTAPSVAHDSSTQLTITTPVKAAGDYDIVVTNTVTGASGTFVNGISYNGVPTWTTATGSLGTFESETTISTITLQATEPDGGTITFNITNGALPTGLSLTGANIDGTTTAESSTTLYSFTIEAIDDENQATPRNFSITVNSAELTPSENFTINTYTGNGSTQSIEGKIGTAADFNGTTSQIRTVGNPIPSTSSLFSISFWFQLDNTNTNNHIFSIFDNVAGTNKLLIRSLTGGDFQVGVYGTSGSNFITTTSSTFSYTTGVWYHLVYISTNTGDNEFWIDGVQKATSSGVAANTTSSTIPITMGGRGDFGGSSTERFGGQLDQVRIFDKALSSGEVTTLYGENNTSSTKSTTDIFDDGSGVALYEFEKGANDTGVPLDGYTPIANRTFESSKSTSSQSTAPRDFEFSSDGTKLFFCDGSNKRIHQYTMTTAWDVSTASHNGYYDVTGQISGGAFPISVQFKNDGTKMYVSTYDTSPERIYEYDLSSAYTVTSGVSYNSKFGNVTVQAWGMEFNSTGTILICSSDVASGNLCKYTLSTAWDISTISLSQQVTLTSIKGIDLSPDGKQLLGTYFPAGNKTIKSYSLSTAYDITTLTQREEWDVNSIEKPQTVTCKFDANNKIDKLYFVGFQQDTIYGYDIDETADFLVQYNGTPTNVSFVGTSFQPDFVWIKNRTATVESHMLYDSIRTATEAISSDTPAAETTRLAGLTSFDSNGFTVGSGNAHNQSGASLVAWCWKAADTTTTISAGTVGNTIASDVRANQDAGFSIVKYTGNGNNSATVGHGLSSAPEMIIVKDTSAANHWVAVHTSCTITGTTSIVNPEYKMLRFDDIDAEYDYQNLVVSPGQSSTTFTLGNQVNVNKLNNTYIAYCFHSVNGYQKLGSYVGNSSTTGPLIDVGFRPRFILVKGVTSGYSSHWVIIDSIRDTDTTKDKRLLPNLSHTEADDSNWAAEFNDNGFQPKSTFSGFNHSNGTYIYLAIA